MKTTIKHENDDFLVITLKHVSGLKVDVKRPGTPKLLAIAYENGHKHKNDEFLVMPQTCIGSYSHFQCP